MVSLSLDYKFHKIIEINGWCSFSVFTSFFSHILCKIFCHPETKTFKCLSKFIPIQQSITISIKYIENLPQISDFLWCEFLKCFYTNWNVVNFFFFDFMCCEEVDKLFSWF